MSPLRSRRVTVTSPQTRYALAGRRTGTRAAPPPLSPANVERARRVHRRQLRLALGLLGVLALLLLGLPLVLAVAPGVAPGSAADPDVVRLAGVPLSWLAVAVLPYPVLAVLAGWQLRRAERVETGRVETERAESER